MRGRWHLGHRLIFSIEKGIEVRRKTVVIGEVISLGVWSFDSLPEAALILSPNTEASRICV